MSDAKVTGDVINTGGMEHTNVGAVGGMENTVIEKNTGGMSRAVTEKATATVNAAKKGGSTVDGKEAMQPLYHVSSSSHIRSLTLTSHIMRDVIIALLPATAFGIFRFGLSAFLVVVATILACVATEYAYQKFMKKPLTIGDLSAVVTGLILALNMPPQIPVWIPMLGGVFAILVVKQIYGGIGFNWMNPALGARCFLLISFTGKMTDFTSTAIGYDAVSGPTPLAAMRELFHAGNLTLPANYTLSDLFFGNIPGTIGEISALALLIGVLYMLIKRIISLRIPAAYLISFSIFVLIFGAMDLRFLLYHLLGGGLIFGAFFMATDYTTSPITQKGQIIFGIFLGVLTAIFRLFGGSAEGVSYAIIIGNILAPLMEKYSIPIAFGKERRT